MFQIRENKQKHTTSYKVTAMLLHTDLPARVTRAYSLCIFVAARKEAVP